MKEYTGNEKYASQENRKKIQRRPEELYRNRDFPFVRFIVTQDTCEPYGAGFHYPHWHDDLQFTIADKGTVLEYVNGVEYELKEGEMLFINSDAIHMTKKVIGDGRFISMNFSPKLLAIIEGSSMEQEYVKRITDNRSLQAILLTRGEEWQNRLIDEFYGLSRYLDQPECYGREYEIVGYLQRMWAAFIANVESGDKKVSSAFIRKQDAVQKILTYLHRNYARKIDLAEICELAHISQAECNRLFQSILNTSPYEYLLHYRMEKACVLLRETNLNVTQVASEVGFNDSSHFIAEFKKRRGVTPGKYRNQHSQTGGNGVS